MDERICTRCGKSKPKTEFHRFVLGRDGLRSDCKECHLAWMRSRYVPRVHEPEQMVCPQCGEPFTRVRRSGNPRIYCSRKCTTAAGMDRKRLRNADLGPRRCACGSIDVSGVGKPVCPACRKESPAAAQRRAERERRRLLSLYGLTQVEYEGLVTRQRNRCAVCKTGKPGGPPTRNGYWHVDHDHVTGQVRGLLCAQCNLGIGKLQDDPEILAAAAQYVARHRQMELFPKGA